MIDQRNSEAKPKRPQGIIACITTGFEIVAQYPLLVLLPILLDLFLWLGPRLSLAPVIEVSRQLLPPPTTDLMPFYQIMDAAFSELSAGFNLFSMLEPAPFVGVPTLMGQRLTAAQPMGLRSILPVPHSLAMLGWMGVLTVVGTGCGALYLWQVGLRVQEGTEAQLPGPLAPAKLWLWLLQLLLGVLVAFLAVGFPVFLFMILLAFFSSGLSAMVSLFFLSIILFFSFHCIYVVPSMVQLRNPPFKAVRESLILTRVDFLGTMGFLCLYLIMTQGLNLVWNMPDPESWTTLIGIGGHAIVSTALTVALFVFYQERLAYLRLLEHTYAMKKAAQSPADT